MPADLSHLLKKFLMENFIFCAVKAYKINALLLLYFKALQEKK